MLSGAAGVRHGGHDLFDLVVLDREKAAGTVDPRSDLLEDHILLEGIGGGMGVSGGAVGRDLDAGAKEGLGGVRGNVDVGICREGDFGAAEDGY
jgi:hypothetical protein